MDGSIPHIFLLSKKLFYSFLKCFRDTTGVPRIDNRVPGIREIITASLESKKSDTYRSTPGT